MLSLLEKLQYGVSGLVVLGVVALYIWQPPEHRDPNTLSGTVRTSSTRPAPPAPAPAPGSGQPAAPPKPAPNPEDRSILDLLVKEQNVRIPAGRELVREEQTVPLDLYKYASREANWQPELNKAKSEFLPGADGRKTRLKLSEIEADSLLSKFGLEDNDVIELIDGQRVDFDASVVDLTQVWRGIQKKLESKQKVSLTLTRGGQPIHIEMKLP